METWQLVLAQARPANQTSPTLSFLLMLAVMFAIFFILIIRPQQKQAKERSAMLASLKKGDNVVVAGGIHARIVEIAENVLVVEIADKVKIRVNRDAVVGLLKPETGTDTGGKPG